MATPTGIQQVGLVGQPPPTIKGANVQPRYANHLQLITTFSEMRLQFGLLEITAQRGAVAEIHTDVIVSPVLAKVLRDHLAQQVTEYERQYGTIRLPPEER